MDDSICILPLEHKLVKLEKTQKNTAGQGLEDKLHTVLNAHTALQVPCCTGGTEGKTFPTTNNWFMSAVADLFTMQLLSFPTGKI